METQAIAPMEYLEFILRVKGRRFFDIYKMNTVEKFEVWHSVKNDYYDQMAAIYGKHPRFVFRNINLADSVEIRKAS